MSLVTRSSAALILLLAAGCTDWEAGVDSTPSDGAGGVGGGAGSASTCSVTTGPASETLPSSHPVGIHAEGNRIVDATGNALVLRGVNRSGTEYQCVSGSGIFDGPSDEASVRAIASWNVNAVRVPLNESCWLGINGSPALVSGEAYRSAIQKYVALLHKYALVPILELHWAAPGDTRASIQYPMPNVDHSLDLWEDVAMTFLDDDGVIFEVFNEPYPDSNHNSDAGWQCWRDGCTPTMPIYDTKGQMHPAYAEAGMQSLVDAIRGTGATQMILLGGLQFSNALTQWLKYEPSDPLTNLGAAWHVYNNNSCNNNACWNDAPASVASAVPLVTTEIGQNDCQSNFVDELMGFLDQRSAGYLAWSWNAYGACSPASSEGGGQPWSLVTSYTCPVPNSTFAKSYHDHLMSFAQ